MEGWFNKISQASLGWLILMGKMFVVEIFFFEFSHEILAFCRTSVHSRRHVLCTASSRKMVSRQIRFMGKFCEVENGNEFILMCISLTVSIPPNIPRARDCSCFCSLPRNQWNGYVSSYRWRMYHSAFGNHLLIIILITKSLNGSHNHFSYWNVLWKKMF